MRTRACQAIGGGSAVAPASLRLSKAAYIGKANKPPSADGGILVERSQHRLFVGPAHSPRKYRDHQNSLLAGNRIDYCNSILCGVAAGRLDRLQSVLNATAQCRSKFKICVLVHNCIIGSSPPYLQELCLPVASVSGRRHLRSADLNDLLVPQFRTVNYGQRGFSTLGPRLWNTLPSDIRISINSLELFKNKLKTYFFQLQQ